MERLHAISEWLAENPEWHVTKDPLVMLAADDDEAPRANRA